MKNRDFTGQHRVMIRYCLAIFLLFIFALSVSLSVPAKAAEQKRRIHIVFDDSGSMRDNYRWSRAEYAMEVFTAMMNNKDELKVYALNAKDELEINGATPDRVNQVHQWGMKHKGGGTPFDKVDKAAKELIDIKENYTDCWLVVLTDGVFDGMNQKQVKDKFIDWNNQGIKIIYMGISIGKGKEIDGDHDKGIYSYKANKSEDILSQIRDITNRIFERLILPSKNVGNTYTLNLDIPTKDIIVFAQGKKVQIGDLVVNGTSKKPAELLNVQYSQNRTYGNEDQTLNGMVAIFNDSKEGEMSVDISDCNEVEFYYDPAVDVDCELSQNGQVIPKDSDIAVGKYHVVGAFTDPTTGKRVKSELLDDKTITLVLENNNQQTAFGVGGGDVELEPGTVTITATADLQTTTLKTIKRYNVVEPSKPPALSMLHERSVNWIRQDQLKDNKKICLVFEALDEETQKPINEDDWKDTGLEIKDQHGIHWDWTRDGMVSPNIKIVPSAAGKYSDADIGVFQFTITTINKYNTQKENHFEFAIDPFEPFRVENVTTWISQEALRGRQQQVVVHIQDPYNNDNPVTGTIWNNVKDLVVLENYGIIWECKRSATEGEYLLVPSLADEKQDAVNPGSYTFTVTAVYNDGGMTDWTAQGMITMEVGENP